jgi:hypothetical protein
VPSASNQSFFGSIGSTFRLFKPSVTTSASVSRGTAGTALASSSAAATAGGGGGGGDTDEAPLLQKPLAGMPRLPSSVELDIHDFSREEIIEKRMYLLNEVHSIPLLSLIQLLLSDFAFFLFSIFLFAPINVHFSSP